MSGARRAVAIAVGLLAAAPAAHALECDQYYAWGRPLQDSTGAINAKINLEIDTALDEVNAEDAGFALTCDEVAKRVEHRFKYFLFMPPEIWAMNSSLVDRVPSTPADELRFREAYVYGRTNRFDTIRWMPPSPTVSIAGVRIGTDKLSHFFSEGAWYHLWYETFRRKGLDPEEAERRAVMRGILTEKTILGRAASGVISLADLEANYEGMKFYNGLCGGGDPMLQRISGAWHAVRRFDLGEHVGVEWDESWQPNLYTASRWKKVRPAIAAYCPMLADPQVEEERASYRRRERETFSEAIVRDLVAEGRLEDPEGFTVDAICGLPPRTLKPVPRKDDETDQLVEHPLGVGAPGGGESAAAPSR